jgi:G3E family GTPase
MTKIDIISGFLGAGKTTLIKKLLGGAFKGEKVVLIENEFGEIGIDGGFLKDAGVEITEMNSGCICCSLVGDFGEALKKVVAQFHPDRIIIEPSGVGKLSDVIKAVQNVEDKLDGAKLNSFSTVVDASKAKVYIKNFGEFFNNQIEYAACIILSRTQNVSEEKLDAAVALLREHNPIARIITTPWDKLTGAQILDAIERRDTLSEELEKLLAETHEWTEEDEEDWRAETEHHRGGHHHHDDDDDEDEDEDEHEHHHHDDDDDDECCHDHHHHHHDDDDEDEHAHEHHHHHHHGHDADEVFQSWGFETVHRFTEDEINTKIAALDDTAKFGTVLRAKGVVAAADGDRWIHFDHVPGEVEIRRGPAGVIGRLCVIGSKINEEALKALFGE